MYENIYKKNVVKNLSISILNVQFSFINIRLFKQNGTSTQIGLEWENIPTQKRTDPQHLHENPEATYNIQWHDYIHGELTWFQNKTALFII